MDGDEAIDGSAVHRRFAENASARGTAAHAAIAPPPAFSNYQSSSATIRLFDPNLFLAAVAVLFWPLKFFPIVLIPAALLAGLTMFKHWNDITADLRGLLGEYSFIIRMLLSLLIVNLGVRLSMGAVVRASGGAVHDFGLTFFLGFIPRFYIDRRAISRLDRRGQLWASGAPLMVRLGFFAFGMLAWATYRSNGTWAANLALLISQAGLLSFLIAIIPFLGDGYNWLAIYLRQPMLRQKALLALNAKLRGRPLPPGIRPREAPGLILLAIGFILAIVALAFTALIVLGVLLFRLQGMGAVIFLALIVAFAIWLLNLGAQLARRKQQPREDRLLQAVMAGQVRAAELESTPAAPRRTRRLLIWAGSGVALIIVAFLPYSYDSAGPFEILPSKGSEVVARTDGQVVDVMVREGDWVNAGQVLAHLSSSDERRDLALTREELAGAETRLTQLQENRSSNRGAVEEAQSEVDRLRHKLEHDEAQLDRTTIRAPVAGFVTTPNPQFLTGVWLTDGDKFLQIDDNRVVEAEIQIPQDDIALITTGAKVRLRPWAEKDREIVGRVTNVAPASLDKADNAGIGAEESAADTGTAPRAARHEWAATVAEEDNGTVGVDELAPKGATLRRRAGTGHELARTGVEKTDNSGVIAVKASVSDTGMLLRPAMTGYAKISGADMTVGEAYLRLCSRFFTVELWSWIP